MLLDAALCPLPCGLITARRGQDGRGALPGAASWPAWPPRGCLGHRHRADSSHRWAGLGCQTWQGTRPMSWPGPIFHQHPPRALGPDTPRCAARSRSLRCPPQAATAPWQGETQPASHRPRGTSSPALPARTPRVSPERSPGDRAKQHQAGTHRAPRHSRASGCTVPAQQEGLGG